MKKGAFAPNLKLSLPPPEEISKFLTGSGTFKDGDLLVNRDGVRIVSQAEVEAATLIPGTFVIVMRLHIFGLQLID
ncbi:hypothetical protein CASFOL_036462 [Castilleja foliolosa]|uniref:Uncharacterized protein n=1 Tax=Castilleja foliolosa TaxID=1961234 RepID=A0ABD3BY16_9LAMI